MEKEFELAILGGGPAGVSAAVYAGRKKLKTALITESFGGQSVVSVEIKNWIGSPSISGYDLAKSFEKHVKEYEGEDLNIFMEKVESVKKEGELYLIKTSKEEEIKAKSIFIATGSDRRKLDVPGAMEFEHKGLTYCASCDGPFFTGKDVVVVGGGNAGFETAAQLLAYTKSVTLLHRSEEYKADAITVKKVLEHPNMTGITNVKIKEVVGDKFVTGIKYTDKNGKEQLLETQGIFVEIGLIPSTDFLKDLVDMDDYGRIKVDPKNQMTSDEMVFAAGDCTNSLFHQNNIASGDAVKALEGLYLKLRAK